MLIYIFPENNITYKEEIEYVSENTNLNDIFLLDKNDYIVLSKVSLTSQEIEEKAKELLQTLTIGSSKIPSGFKAIIPSDTRILSLKYENNIIKVDFSEEIFDVEETYEEKMIEAIVYTLTSLENVDGVIIYVEGEILTKLPKTKINLPSTLNRNFGINKEYDFTKTDDINSVTIYYINKMNDDYYYVPVTKYLNDDREKITIVIDELSNSLNNNLMSFLNTNTKIVSSDITDDTLSLDFNSYIFDDINTKEVLEEVIYTICLSAYDNYDIKKVVLTSGNTQIYKSE